MGTLSSSQKQSITLFIVSLVVSLALHGEGLPPPKKAHLTPKFLLTPRLNEIDLQTLSSENEKDHPDFEEMEKWEFDLTPPTYFLEKDPPKTTPYPFAFSSSPIKPLFHFLPPREKQTFCPSSFGDHDFVTIKQEDSALFDYPFQEGKSNLLPFLKDLKGLMVSEPPFSLSKLDSQSNGRKIPFILSKQKDRSKPYRKKVTQDLLHTYSREEKRNPEAEEVSSALCKRDLQLEPEISYEDSSPFYFQDNHKETLLLPPRSRAHQKPSFNRKNSFSKLEISPRRSLHFPSSFSQKFFSEIAPRFFGLAKSGDRWQLGKVVEIEPAAGPEKMDQFTKELLGKTTCIRKLMENSPLPVKEPFTPSSLDRNDFLSTHTLSLHLLANLSPKIALKEIGFNHLKRRNFEGNLKLETIPSPFMKEKKVASPQSSLDSMSLIRRIPLYPYTHKILGPTPTPSRIPITLSIPERHILSKETIFFPTTPLLFGEKKRAIPLEDQKVVSQKLTFFPKRGVVDALSLPFITQKRVSPKKKLDPTWQSSDFGKEVIEIAQRKKCFPNIRELVEGSPLPTPIPNAAPLPTKEYTIPFSVTISLDPDYLETEEVTIALKEHPFDYLKGEILANKVDVTIPSLPYIKTERVAPSKKRKGLDHALASLPSGKAMVEMAQRRKFFPNTRELLEGSPVPLKLPSSPIIQVTNFYPKVPIYYPRVVPELSNEASSIALLESQIKYLKKGLPFQKNLENDFPLPYLKRRKVSPLKEVMTPYYALDSLPSAKAMVKLAQRKKCYPNARALLDKSPFPAKASTPLPLDTRAPQLKLPPVSPLQIPQLTLDSSSIALQEKSLDYLKKHLLPKGIEGQKFSLPYVKRKKVAPKKELFAAYQTLPAPPLSYDLAAVVQRETNFPNIRALTGRSSLPTHSPSSPLAPSPAKFQEIETSRIQSSSKEMIESYAEEAISQGEAIPLLKSDGKENSLDEKIRSTNKSSRFTNAFLAEIPPPSYLNTATYDNEFKTEVHYARREDGKGYLFAVKMNPKEELSLTPPNKNFIFVIDGSSSIQRHRFGVFKEGVQRAIGYMEKGDLFNIIMADAELIPFEKTSVPWSKQTTMKAKRFLQNRKYRGFFINYDAFDLLAQVTKYFDPKRENIVILLTDGHSFSTIKKHKEDFQELSAASKGKFSIYTATASHGNNLSMLDLVSTFNGGELMYSKTNAAFSRQLARLVKHIGSFVAKDIHVKITASRQDMGIEFYPNQDSLPPLYSDKAYTLYGSIDELKDFDLILQGRNGDEWINIKQHITFKHAQKASHAIKRGFALQKAYVCYSYFLENEDPFFLNEAERILNPYGVPSANQ